MFNDNIIKFIKKIVKKFLLYINFKSLKININFITKNYIKIKLFILKRYTYIYT